MRWKTYGAIATIIAGAAVAPVVPQDIQLLYSYEMDCPVAAQEMATSTISPRPPEYLPSTCTNGHAYVSVFRGLDGSKVYEEIPQAQYRAMGRTGGYAHNPKKSQDISIIQALTPKADAAIAFDSATAADVTGTSLTFSKTNTGSNLLLLVGVGMYTTTDTITGVTYNGVDVPLQVSQGFSSARSSMYGLIAPATGANNVVISSSVSRSYIAQAASYTGVKQTGFPDNTNTGSNASGNNFSDSITINAANAWVALSAVSGNGSTMTATASTDTTRRTINIDGAGGAFFDNGANASAGASKTIDVTFTDRNPTASTATLISFVAAPTAAPPSQESDLIWFD